MTEVEEQSEGMRKQDATGNQRREWCGGGEERERQDPSELNLRQTASHTAWFMTGFAVLATNL